MDLQSVASGLHSRRPERVPAASLGREEPFIIAGSERERKMLGFCRRKSASRDETAANADGILAEAFGPKPFQAYPDGRQYGDVEDGEQGFRNAFGCGKVECDPAE